METAKINRLKIVLVEQGKTGKWLAGQLGKNEATISRWCSNVSQPSLEMLMKIASILDIDARRLIDNGKDE
ncbi:helix-turn-helix transcriptional regulator [Coprobacter fastidiosus]|uniref:Helix-turn-helix protein n=1 Tax=Coprobacter fastidiosus NSB1 = JCM 33896 TaxID=1349822 RepID=A0A495VKR3_9BACT|nr:helix-turn-helix transcriptional regulator [Coprobacter fastidiosus]ERM89983.1 DNA-binding protein [Coprobacter fastidiosus NSB1 = JCM 33896]RKT49852.1 helix-turn-helix protein [Coprobacter fastidiosus NSB1 = JCM 33896]BEG63130.1 helix-turn-helix transcriptional regulator [Coprobacter fastidiosus]